MQIFIFTYYTLLTSVLPVLLIVAVLLPGNTASYHNQNGVYMSSLKNKFKPVPIMAPPVPYTVSIRLLLSYSIAWIAKAALITW